MAINSVSVSGNLTRDPELKSTQGGTPILHLGIAVNDRRKNQQTGEWEDVPNFFNVTVFGRRAESLDRILEKGAKVAVHGRLHWSQWQAKDGSNRSSVDIIADEIDLMSRGRDHGEQQPRQQQPTYRAPQQPAGGDVYDESIPF